MGSVRLAPNRKNKQQAELGGVALYGAHVLKVQQDSGLVLIV